MASASRNFADQLSSEIASAASAEISAVDTRRILGGADGVICLFPEILLPFHLRYENGPSHLFAGQRDHLRGRQGGEPASIWQDDPCARGPVRTAHCKIFAIVAEGDGINLGAIVDLLDFLEGRDFEYASSPVSASRRQPFAIGAEIQRADIGQVFCCSNLLG